MVLAVSLVSSILCTATVLLTEEPAFYQDGRCVLSFSDISRILLTIIQLLSSFQNDGIGTMIVK